MKLFYTPLLRAMVHRALRGEALGPGEIDVVFDDALRRYREEGARLPREPSAGGRLMVRLAALTASFYQALIQRGMAPVEARRLTAVATEFIYARITAIPAAAARVMRRGTADRVAFAIKLMRTFPFGPPAYDMRDVEAPGAVGFDVRRCPTADYFHTQGLEELCVESWCNLDYEMARRWGARLDRSQTLAGGADHCDFRFRVEEGVP